MDFEPWGEATVSGSAVEVLSIGAVLGDSDATNVAWKRAIAALGKEVVALRAGAASPLRVNVVFHVEGRMVPNEFHGVRAGRYRTKDNHLMVQAAVPSGPIPGDRSVLVSLLGAAVDHAESFARDRGIADRLDGLRLILDGLSRA
ncbi:hypothetical protein [Microbacterium immunditiarum]|uniref:Uncharacterized protein n=1 Tax=Microbacterium immunditiarum TaxID=337480 RepID=A0A7Y9GRY7_9MICO|nr:hypothetical protein [Microbacterium immunditiarum]NYE21603.1 hypothetical protein [Microbacterium immunditiarum]